MTPDETAAHAAPSGADMTSISLKVNGQDHVATVESRKTLADFIREDLRLTGTHLGCEHGVCGTCTVVLDGAPARACLTLAVQADGCSVETVESLADEELHPIQVGMRRRHSFQCAYCAPGMLMTVRCLLEANPEPTRDEIRDGISGNLCRCTGYQSIVEGVEEAVKIMKAERGRSGA